MRINDNEPIYNVYPRKLFFPFVLSTHCCQNWELQKKFVHLNKASGNELQLRFELRGSVPTFPSEVPAHKEAKVDNNIDTIHRIEVEDGPKISQTDFWFRLKLIQIHY